MATQPEAKIDAAAEKAYAEASAARKADVKEEAAPAAAPKPAAKAAPVQKAPAKKPAAKKKTTVAKKAAAPKRKPAPAKTTAPKSTSKDTIMTKAKTTANDYATKLKEGMADLQTRAKTAYDKGTEYAAEMRDFSQGNLDAAVESGKIFAAGMQDMAKLVVEDGKSAVETMTADAKEFAAVKSPTDFVQLQGKIASRNFDTAVAQFSKATELWVKLAGDVAAPISGRVSLAMDKVRKAA